MINGILLKNIRVRETYAIAIKNIDRIIVQENFRQMFLNWMLESKEFNLEKFKIKIEIKSLKLKASRGK